MQLKSKSRDILRERRLALGFTQQQVADRAGIKLQHYQAFEGGQRSLMTASFRTTCGVLVALDLDIATYYSGDYTLEEGL